MHGWPGREALGCGVQPGIYDAKLQRASLPFPKQRPLNGVAGLTGRGLHDRV